MGVRNHFTLVPLLDLPAPEKTLIGFVMMRGRLSVWTAYSGTLDESLACQLGWKRRMAAKTRKEAERKDLLIRGTNPQGRPTLTISMGLADILKQAEAKLETRQMIGPKHWSRVEPFLDQKLYDTLADKFNVEMKRAKESHPTVTRTKIESLARAATVKWLTGQVSHWEDRG